MVHYVINNSKKKRLFVFAYENISSVFRGPGFAPAGPLAPADCKGPGPGGAAAPAESWGPAPGGAATPAHLTGPAGAGARPGTIPGFFFAKFAIIHELY